MTITRRGYALLRRADNAQVVRSWQQVARGEQLHAELADGRLLVEVLAANEDHAAPEATDAASTLPASITPGRSEEHTSELQSLMRTSYAAFCLKKKKNHTNNH